MRSVGFGFLLFLVALVPTNCSNSWDKFWEVQGEDALAKCRTAVSGDSVSMICVPANTTGFSRGWAGLGTPIHTVASISGFAMGKYEVKYAEWEVVRLWAISNGYTFANLGVQGDGTATTDQHPATSMNWRDMVIWCNAASQKNGLTPVYYTDAALTAPMKIATNNALSGATTVAGGKDNPYILWSANGYRLPTSAEYEYAARYENASTFTRGDAPSGWKDNNPANGAIDQAEKNAVSWDNNSSPGNTQPVGQLQPNALGFYDLSGNVFELSNDWLATYVYASPFTDADSKGGVTGTNREVRGGGFGGEFGTAARGSTVPNAAAAERGVPFVRRL
jgi:formylglycine-generating enzyme required for sulfatase activity